jgi:hypothetical protein
LPCCAKATISVHLLHSAVSVQVTVINTSPYLTLLR